ncbi:hypothetical protein AC1031_001456 [Aphanomyces cochlioides]|nr:hypothetical protein AC1031_001456 [Aphanomyces cochlioides]
MQNGHKKWQELATKSLQGKQPSYMPILWDCEQEGDRDDQEAPSINGDTENDDIKSQPEKKRRKESLIHRFQSVCGRSTEYENELLGHSGQRIDSCG